MEPRIFLSPPHMSGLEEEYIHSAFLSNYIAPGGENVNQFEIEIENFIGNNKSVVALNSGTSAIHLALILLGIKANDEVICQTNTFIATANPILYQAAIPVFVDSEKDTYNLCPDLLVKAIKDRIDNGKSPAAIIVVHAYGMPCKFEEIQTIALRYNIPIIEDSAEALGSTYKSQACGSLGNFGVFSFNGNKIITTSSGGALICSSTEKKQKAIYYSTQAKQNLRDYVHLDLGYNYRMSNVLAGLGRGQIKVLQERVNKRREIFAFYKKNIPSLQFLEEAEGIHSNRWLTTALLDNNEKRNVLMKHLENHNIETRTMWKPLHTQELYKDFPSYVNGVSEELHERGICLPSGSGLTKSDLERITSLINSYLDSNE